MGRPKQTNRREKQFNVSLTTDEYAQLHGRAGAAGLRPTDYARARLFTGDFQTLRRASQTRHLDPLFLSHVSRIGNNLNQIARQLNAQRLAEPALLAPLLAELRAILRRESIL